ncbi:MAG: GNAT family N-acetyltransferase [Halobacteriaceae archaeon]
MDIRQATPDDAPEIRSVARRSLAASYEDVLGEDAVDAAVDQWYDADDLEEKLADGDVIFLVAEDGGEVCGFAQSTVVNGAETVGEIHWVHVAPDSRGRGIGSQLLSRTEDALHGRGVDRIAALVLQANDVGNEFYADRDFELAGERRVEIGDRRFVENEYAKEPPASRTVERYATPDDRTVYVDRDAPERGSKGSFYPAYTDEDRQERYGWLCDNCESLDTTMDAMGRVECAECHNVRRPTRWDAAYL